MAETFLQMAHRHVESTRKIVAAQTDRVDRLQAAGKDATDAVSMLAQFKRTLSMFEDDLQRIQQEGPRISDPRIR